MFFSNARSYTKHDVKKFLYICFVLLLTIPLVVTDAFGTRRKVAQSGMQFLKIGVGARAAAMGEACLAVVNHLDAMFWNPGALALCQGSGFSLNQTSWIADINQYYMAIGVDLKHYGFVGVNLLYMDYPDIVATRVPLEGEFAPLGYIPLGNLDVHEFAVGLVYSRRITNKLSIGGQVKLVYQDLWKSVISISDSSAKTDDNLANELAYDFGTVYYTGFKSLRFGMTVLNFSRDIKYRDDQFPMPLTFKMGLAMDLMDFWQAQHKQHSLTLAIDVLHPRDNYERIHIGIEYWFLGLIALRGGYKFNYDEESYTVGVGFKVSFGGMAGNIDYAYADFGPYLGSVNRFSFNFLF